MASACGNDKGGNCHALDLGRAARKRNGRADA